MSLMLSRFIGFFLALFYFPLAITLGFKRRVTNFQKHWEKAGRPLVRCGWHEDIVAFVYRLAFRKMCVMASQSKDGEIITSGLRTLGFRVARGSSTRGGSGAFRGMLKAFREGWNISLMVDGPKGPHRVIKPGVLLLASATGSPVVPTIIVVKWCIRVHSWDRMVIPLPFSPSVELDGRPIMIPRNPTEEELKSKLKELETEYKNLDLMAENIFVKYHPFSSR